MVAGTDVSKILFSSDLPFHDIRFPFGSVAFADLDDDVKKRIFSGNYIDMLKKYPKV